MLCGRFLTSAVTLLAVAAFGLISQAHSADLAASVQPTALDRAFQRAYSFDFTGAIGALDDAAKVDPANPLIESVRAGIFQFQEMARLHILETDFFLRDRNMVDGSSTQKPDPQVRARLFAALDAAKARANARLTRNPDDLDALLALCMSAGVETDYTALVERRTWRSSRMVPNTLKYAHKLLARTPPFYDAYLNVGAVEYIVGDLPFFLRWFIHYDTIQGNKTKGIEELRLVADRGRFYRPYARVLLVLAALREKRPAEARQLLQGLATEFPENPVFGKELARMQVRASGSVAR